LGPDDFRHGATDSDPDPIADFSTNVNPLGPCPGVERALARADRRRYPDPEYRAVRESLAAHHGTSSDRVVVGAGASEIIFRMVSALPGAVLVRTPTFVEYRKAASAFGRPVLVTDSDNTFLDRLSDASVAFLCHPNNPDGRLHEAAFLDAAVQRARESGTRLVLDLAYAPMCPNAVHLPEGVEALWAPNKPLDCAGVRAGYLVASDSGFATRLADLAPSWILSAEGVEVLTESVEPETLSWLRDGLTEIVALRDGLAAALADRNWQVAVGAANFLVAKPPAPMDAASACTRLRSQGIRVRDAANMGMPGWIRMAARPREELAILVGALQHISD